jgi:hypothetical protein
MQCVVNNAEETSLPPRRTLGTTWGEKLRKIRVSFIFLYPFLLCVYIILTLKNVLLKTNKIYAVIRHGLI